MEIKLGNWLYNAGIIGFLRILASAGKPIDKIMNGQYVNITPDLLQDFEKAYFGFIMKKLIYPQALSFKKKYGKEGFLDLLKNKKDILDGIEIKYRNGLEKVINSEHMIEISKLYDVLEKSVKGYFKEIENNINQSPKSLSKKSDKKNSEQDSKKKALKILKDAKNDKMFRKKKGKDDNWLSNIKTGKQFFNILQGFYKNKSVVGQSKYGKYKSRMEAFQKEYVEPTQNLLSQTSNNNKPACRFCHQLPAATHKKGSVVFEESLFSPIGVSSSKFPNFFYKNNPDLFICKVCELIFLCSFAGFNRKPRQLERDSDTNYLFVNLPDFHQMWSVNKIIAKRYQLWSEKQNESIYDTIFKNILLQEEREKSLWVLQNVLFVEIRPQPNKAQTKPRFLYSALGKDLAKLFRDPFAWSTLRKIPNRIVDKKSRPGPQNIWLKNDIVKTLLEHFSLYPLCFRVVKIILNNENSFGIESCFSLSFIQSLLKQIQKFLKGGGSMEAKTIYGILQSFYQNGKDFEEIDIEKRRRYAYKLLSLIRGRQYHEFCNNILQLYLTIKKAPTGKNLVSLLNREDIIDFEAKAYAFMSGFLSERSMQMSVETPEVSEGEKKEVSS